jgi:hypothetical protein
VPRTALSLVSFRLTLPPKSRAFAPVTMKGTGETDSPPEEDGFEPSVPPEKGSTSSRCSTFPALPFERDRGFESAFLQRRVYCELPFGGTAPPPACGTCTTCSRTSPPSPTAPRAVSHCAKAFLQRCYRDAHSGTQHILLADEIVTECGRVLLGTTGPNARWRFIPRISRPRRNPDRRRSWRPGAASVPAIGWPLFSDTDIVPCGGDAYRSGRGHSSRRTIDI